MLRGDAMNMLQLYGSIAFGVLLLISLAAYGMAGSAGEGKLEYKVYYKDKLMSGAYKVYGNPDLQTWAAKVVISNTGSAAIKNVKVTYSIDTYGPEVQSDVYALLQPNGTIVDLYYPVLSSKVTEFSASVNSNLRVKVSYQDSSGAQKEETASKSVQFLGVRDFVFSSLGTEESTGSFSDIFNNMPLLAAWVTPSDPVVREFADMGNKIAGGAGASLSDAEAIKSLGGMWELAVRNGFAYKTEQASYWTGKFSEHIMFPRDVIQDKSGTCIDLAVWFASLAMSQGLDAYIITIPGHAFPIIKLPSGTEIAVEATSINEKVSFTDAVNAGQETFTDAMKGPYVETDVAEMHAAGVAPPELPMLPVNTLKEWGITEQGTQQAGQQTGTGTAGQTAGTTAQLTTYQGDGFSFGYPNTWQAPRTTGLYLPRTMAYSLATSPDGKLELIVFHGVGENAQTMKGFFEQTLAYLGFTITTQQATTGAIAGLTVDATVYATSSTTVGNRMFVSRYFYSNGVGYNVVYDYPIGTSEEQSNQLTLGEQIVGSFKLG